MDRLKAARHCRLANRSRQMKKSLAVTALLLVASAAAAQQRPPFEVAETGKAFWRLDDAVRAIGDGDGTIVIAPGTYGDCASQRGGNITYRAAVAGQAIFDGGICEGKAALVLGGLSARVEGLVFRNMRVPDGNGAGIRLEKGNLDVVNSMFRNSEEGILSAPDPEGEVVIDRSTFSGLGRCDRGLSCAHSIYIGDYGSLTVTRSRFERGRGGHYLKSNSGRVSVSDSSFDDSQGKATNYMIDLPSGAVGTITGNTFVQGRDKENHSAFIAVAAEARTHPSAGLSISGNDARMAPGVEWPSVFVADWSHEPLRLGANKLGPGLKPFEVR
jgi:Right handed beta helix region